MTFLHHLWHITLDLAPWLLLGAFAAGLLHLLVPDRVIVRLLGRPGWRSAVLAAVVGIPMPLCSCAVIPTGLGLRRQGASPGATVSFLTATPQTGVDSVAVTVAFLGWPFALFKVGAALVTGVVAGLLADRVGHGSDRTDAAEAEESTNDCCAGGGCDGPAPSGTEHAQQPGPLTRLWSFAVDDLLHSIWRWLVFGIVVSALISTFLPTDSLAVAGTAGALGAMFVALAVSVPLYVCATASVPIAASLVAAGLPTGAALVFLMAGPATNVATLGAVARGLGRGVAGVYLGTVVVGSFGLGLAYDLLIGIDVATAGSEEHEHGGWIAPLTAGLLVTLFAWFALRDIRAWWRRRRSGAESASACRH